jgi:hypothetical protein
MMPVILDSVKRLLLVGILSALSVTAVTALWLKFPSLVPLGVFIIVGFVGALTFLVSEVIVVLGVAKLLTPPGPLAVEMSNLPRRSLVALTITLVVCNGALIYFTDLRPMWVYVLAASLSIVVSWVVARSAAARRIERRDGR